MSVSSEEIARDLLIAAVQGKQNFTPDGEWLGENFKTLLKAVDEACQDELMANRQRR
ncbi:hypothetical protein [Stenotrophomonas maltophilia]|uniref:hypothetical protein n=1 Tax=Stenotrophomonas maltophilia TaxID=40324 RepID=UPI001788D278|nr:hypothetical protein [Stenotrophomonas maltophilia]